MHLCYIDETGSSGKNLADRQQPIFAMAGLLVSDEKWKRTERESRAIVEKALGSSPPAGFEIHAGDLLAPHGAGPFKDWPHGGRTQPALPLAIDWMDPWELGFAALEETSGGEELTAVVAFDALSTAFRHLAWEHRTSPTRARSPAST